MTILTNPYADPNAETEAPMEGDDGMMMEEYMEKKAEMVLNIGHLVETSIQI